MDEEKNVTYSDRGPVRPSMVIMTSKLLNVTEGMAAMNMRIACGVVLCIILLVATFIVNIVAFEYAKDNKVSNGALVDKETGMAVMIATAKYQSSSTPPLITLDLLLPDIKEISLETEGAGSLSVPSQGYMIAPCPDGVSAAMQTEYCHTDGLTYLVFASNGMVAYYKMTEDRLDSALVEAADASEFVSAAVSLLSNEHKSRSLLDAQHQWVRHTQCTCNAACSFYTPYACNENVNQYLCTGSNRQGHFLYNEHIFRYGIKYCENTQTWIREAIAHSHGASTPAPAYDLSGSSYG